MVADQVQERLVADEVAGTVQRVAVAAGLVLGGEADPQTRPCGGGGVALVVGGVGDDRHILDPGALCLGQDDRQRGLLGAVAVDDGLQRQRALIRAGGGDDGFLDVHGRRKVAEPRVGCPRLLVAGVAGGGRVGVPEPRRCPRAASRCQCRGRSRAASSMSPVDRQREPEGDDGVQQGRPSTVPQSTQVGSTSRRVESRCLW
jgi:hypothetical protein